MRRTRIMLAIVLAASIALSFVIRGIFPAAVIDEHGLLENVSPDATFGIKRGSPPYYPSSGGDLAAFNTYDVVPWIRGYAGPIRCLVALGSDGRIKGLVIAGHNETPNYTRAMTRPEFLSQFIGKHVSDAFEPDRDIDGISRATVSVRALSDSVREAARAEAAALYGIRVTGASDGDWIPGHAKAMGCIAIFALAWLGYLFTRRKRSERLRDAILVIGLAGIGIWLSSPFSIMHVYNLFMGRYSTDWLWVALVAGVAVSMAFAGRLYCGWLCPFGALSELLGRLPVGKWETDLDGDLRLRRIKYIILAACTAAVVIAVNPRLANFEPYVTLFSFGGTWLAWGVLATATVFSLRVKRFWCRHICPVGAFGGLLTRTDKGYSGSGECPMGNMPSMPRDCLNAECIRCNRCFSRMDK